MGYKSTTIELKEQEKEGEEVLVVVNYMTHIKLSLTFKNYISEDNK